MIPVERRQIILEMVAEKGIVSIAELTDRMNVSHMTIRRDLQKLEQQGAVVLVSGGVQSPGRVAHEPSHQVKTALAMTQKAAIGKLAASLVQPGRCIYLDAGTTTLAIAQHLTHMEPLTVVTNDFVIADYLLDNSNCTIIHTGGAVCRENRSCVGEAAATMLRSLMIDQAFISASSWSVRGIDLRRFGGYRVAGDQSGYFCRHRHYHRSENAAGFYVVAQSSRLRRRLHWRFVVQVRCSS